MNRRDSIRTLSLGLAAALAGGTNAFASVLTKRKMTVYKSPTCGCCKSWVKHVSAAFDVHAIDVDDVAPYKDKQGVPQDLRSCHTAVVDGYAFEGHVPADLIKKFLAAPPKGAKGLAVPGMPMGSPGMEMGTMKDKYDVVQFNTNGSHRVYAHR